MRKEELRAFLVERRARLKPEDVGLSRAGGPRASGLRRDEVAALAGVSTQLYARFESGSRPRDFSVDFVRRVADALRLDSHERIRLSRLALPDVAEATDQLERSIYDGAARFLKQLREFTKKIASASSFDEAAVLGVELADRVIGPDCMTAYNHRGARGLPSVYAQGPRALAWGPISQEIAYDVHAPLPGATALVIQNVALPEDVRGAAVQVVYENAGSDGPSPYDFECAVDRWREINRARMRSALAVTLHEASVYRGTLVSAFTKPQSVKPIHIEFMATLGAILDLTASGSADGLRAKIDGY